jgi:hypothetical protein
LWEDVGMSEQSPEFDKIEGSDREFSETVEERKSITGSAQAIGFEPGANFVAPTMALDAIEADPDE